MGQVFKGGWLEVLPTIGRDIAGTSAPLVKYRKPDSEEGEWEAEILDEETGALKAYKEMDQDGDWVFWGHVTQADGKPLSGEPGFLHVYKEGEKEKSTSR